MWAMQETAALINKKSKYNVNDSKQILQFMFNAEHTISYILIYYLTNRNNNG